MNENEVLNQTTIITPAIHSQNPSTIECLLLDSFSNEVLDHIFSNLTVRETKQARLVCKRWKEICGERLRIKSTWRMVQFCSYSENQSFPKPVASHCCVIIGDDMFVYGGGTYQFGGPIHHFIEIRSELWKFNLISKTWKLYRNGDDVGDSLLQTAIWKSANSQVTEHSLVTFNNELYCFGGTNKFTYTSNVSHLKINEQESKVISSTVQINIHSEEPPAPRSAHTSVVIGDQMLVFGGWNGIQTFDDLWSWNFTDHKWSNLSSPNITRPKPRRTHSSVAIGSSEMLIFGGYNDINGSLNDTWIFDLEVHTWFLLNTTGTIPKPRGRCSMVFDTLRNSVILFGGWDRKDSNSDYFELSLNNFVWTKLETNFLHVTKGGICHQALLLHEDMQKLFLFGGFCTQTIKFSNSLFVDLLFLKLLLLLSNSSFQNKQIINTTLKPEQNVQ